MDYPENYCSKCQYATKHTLQKQNYLRRNVYRCGGCEQLTVSCMVPGCKHMALTGKFWDDNLCAEHDGSVPSLHAAKMPLPHLAEYDQVLKRESIDFSNAGKWAMTTASVAAIAMPAASIAIGGARLALMSTGSVMSALAKQTHFHIRRERDGEMHQHAVIFINGLGSQDGRDVTDWTEHLDEHFPQHSWFHVDWEAQQLMSLSVDTLAKLAKFATGINPGGLAGMAYDNPWHAAVRNSKVAGKLLADAIARTPGWRYTLAGHSLGARVIRFALADLAERGIKCVDDVYLLGGAVGGTSKNSPEWRRALKAMDGVIYNCHTLNDQVLALAYRGAAMGTCNAAGHRGIALTHDRVHNFDCDELVFGHTEWKGHFGEILRQLGTTAACVPPVKKRTRSVKKPAH